MADGGATFYIAMAAMTAGTVVSTIDARNANKARQLALEEELRANELAAIDEENNRLISLRLANDDLLVNAGGVDAWASASLVAARAFNFEMGMQDIDNIRYGIATDRSGISRRISILKANTRATNTAGIFQVAGFAASTANRASQLGRTTIAANGTGGANATRGVGHLDLPRNTPGAGLA